MNHPTYIASSGSATPAYRISNEELVACYNEYVKQHPQMQLELSDCGFIEKASGIKSRFVLEKKGVLDLERMCPYYPPRSDEQLSLQAEFALQAINDALKNVDLKPEYIDGIICACSNHQRAYPAIAIEIQNALGARGWAFDMNVACSSATFAIANAFNAIQSGQCDTIVVVSPEIASGQLNYKDRDSHFIFGDGASALVISKHAHISKNPFRIKSCKMLTRFSNNIRNNWGFLNNVERKDLNEPLGTSLFKQNGRKVFKEVVPVVCEHISQHLGQHKCSPSDIERFWLHQANLNMNQLIAKKLLGDDYPEQKAPVILDQHANTGSPGAVLAFHHHHDDLSKGHLGILCSFGAGYSVGSILVEKE